MLPTRTDVEGMLAQQRDDFKGLTSMRKFGSITKAVPKDLPQPYSIALEVSIEIGSDIFDESDPFFPSHDR